MVELSGDEYLRVDERWARHLLEGTVGQTRVTDRRGGPEGRHDLEAVLPDGGIASIEITSEADQARLRAAAAARRHLTAITVPGSQFGWIVTVIPQADMHALAEPDGLVALLTDMEQRGQSSASALSDYRDPWRDRLAALGIQSVHGLQGSDHPGAVYVLPDSVARRGWVQSTADQWIAEFLASDLGQRKLDKLGRADAAECHLVVLMYPDTDAGLGIVGALIDLHDGVAGDSLPTVVPPPPLTHLWLVAPIEPPRAFRWASISGWTVFGWDSE